jgi:NTE family protein
MTVRTKDVKGQPIVEKQIDHLILGGGAAAATAAATLRLDDADCSITILSADESPPYYRPALSKQFLLGSMSEDRILLHPASYYREHNIDLVLGEKAVALDSATQIVTTATGRRERGGMTSSGWLRCNVAVGTSGGGFHLERRRRASPPANAAAPPRR